MFHLNGMSHCHTWFEMLVVVCCRHSWNDIKSYTDWTLLLYCVYLHIYTAYIAKRQSYSTSTAWNKECVPCCAGLYWICIYPLFPSKTPWLPALRHSLPRPYKWSWRLSTSFTTWHFQSTNHGHFWEKLVTFGPSFLGETWHFGRGTVKFQWSYDTNPNFHSFKREIPQIIFWNQVWSQPHKIGPKKWPLRNITRRDVQLDFGRKRSVLSLFCGINLRTIVLHSITIGINKLREFYNAPFKRSRKNDLALLGHFIWAIDLVPALGRILLQIHHPFDVSKITVWTHAIKSARDYPNDSWTVWHFRTFGGE